MADEKNAPATEAPELGTAEVSNMADTAGPVQRPRGWMYKGFRVAGKEIWYASPIVQLLMVAMVCFLCPGMFNALTGLGGGGQVDPSAQNDAATALNSTFAVVAFFSGTIANKLGVKATLAFGGLGYCIYAGSFLSYNHNQNHGFVVFAGAFLGVCAGLLWTAQGTIMMSYPPEAQKGRYISYFWIIFNLGAVIGALVPLGQNVNATGATNVTDGTYIGLIVLMFTGAVLAMSLCNADKVRREDGSKVILMKNPSWKTEFIGLFETITSSPWVILLFPMFFASNIFYTYQLNDFNGAHFNTRTRALNNLLYWTSQIFGAIVFGYGLDFPGARRSIRAKGSFIALVAVTFAIWGGGYAWQIKQVPREIVENKDSGYEQERVDWTDGGERYIGPMFLFIFYGFFDAAFQTCIYWYMGALSNSGRKAANLAGFYKGIQSAGAAVYWRLDGLKTPYNTMFGATWGLLAAALFIAAPVIFTRIKDTVTLEEDLKFSDETAEDVAPAKDVAVHDKHDSV
ncbi:major facilitator superfamily domain-containing protein [Chaetomium fimeti]|jgi:MFS family permease|uniref:Major facilitator superfamily domain-containing protein n=1 Tax=Chaetomium fimeti TaxID=1854472 RepID=A0AAE0HC98_9PEZI|nr:major facilitator superfamily domain-containing protein [Chaetomium fimeti]